MCGVVFLFNPSQTAEERQQRVAAALLSLAHRGPDDSGIVTSSDSTIGHRRLSIIDLGGSRQPMEDATGRYVLSYNGEVYNYAELRKNLETHWTFQSHGDTEVVLAGLVVHGPRFLELMEGMWALTLWDRQEKSLLLARDRMGKKPLYFRHEGQAIAVASELPALKMLLNTGWEESLDSTADYLRYGYYLPGTTAYRQTSEVLPGHYATWSLAQGYKSVPYWSLKPDGFQGSHRQACEQLQDYLRTAVKRRLVSDVEVGAFLSGGIDSSLIVSILTKQLGVRCKTFTIGFTEKSYDEREPARRVAEYCNTEHFEECLSDWDGERLTALVLNHIGQPFADSSLLPTELVSGLASRHVKVVLSGDGGDELFSGYQRYQARAILRWYTRLPEALRGLAGRAIRALPEPMAHHSGSVLKKAHLFQDVVNRLEAETPYVAPVMYATADFARLAPDLAGRGHPAPRLPEVSSLDDVQQMMVADALIYLPQDILVKVDRASMAHSLEARAPFLDRSVVELAFSLPRRWHRAGNVGKRMLRKSFTGVLPDFVWSRRKQGFAVPVHEWFRGGIGQHLLQLLDGTPSPLDKNRVLELFRQHHAGMRDHGYRLWNIYIYLLWRNRINI